MTNTDENHEQQEIIELLPWHAAGNLKRHDAERVERALARDPELARHYQLVREELVEAVHVNESLGAPSARVAQRLFAAIDAQGATGAGTQAPAGAGLAARILEFMSTLSPRTLAWSAGAAALAILLQAGVITTMLVTGRGNTFETASYGSNAETEGPTVLVRFVPQATAAEIADFLNAYKASIVAGPMGGGMFRLRVPVPSGTTESLAQIVRRMQQSKIVGFVAAAG